MRALPPTFCAVALWMLTSVAASAQTAAPRVSGATDPAPGRPALDLSITDRTWSRERASPTALDHSFAPDGLSAQVGYLCGIGGIGPDANPDHGGPASTFGRQGTFLGASVGYAFR